MRRWFDAAVAFWVQANPGAGCRVVAGQVVRVEGERHLLKKTIRVGWSLDLLVGSSSYFTEAATRWGDTRSSEWLRWIILHVYTCYPTNSGLFQ